jgi:hypothetical protein
LANQGDLWRGVLAGTKNVGTPFPPLRDFLKEKKYGTRLLLLS